MGKLCLVTDPLTDQVLKEFNPASNSGHLERVGALNTEVPRRLTI